MYIFILYVSVSLDVSRRTYCPKLWLNFIGKLLLLIRFICLVKRKCYISLLEVHEAVKTLALGARPDVQYIT